LPGQCQTGPGAGAGAPAGPPRNAWSPLVSLTRLTLVYMPYGSGYMDV